MFYTYLISLASGVLTALSPCVLPLLPIILGSGIDGDKKRARGIVVGILTSFSIAILLLSSVVSAFNISEIAIRLGASLLLFVIGVLLIFPFWDKLQFKLEGLFNINLPEKYSGNSFWAGFVTGLALGIVWTPCVGPIVSAVATLAAVNELTLTTVFLVLSYALGLGLPLWLIADKGTEFTSKLNFFKKHSANIRKIFGIIIFATAIFIAIGGEKKLQTWFLDTLPDSWTQLATNFETRFENNEEIQMPEAKEETTYNKVDPDDLVIGCIGGKDCIPSIDNPKFETTTQANTWLNADDTVFGVNLNGIQRAYPQRILNWHEIVNDKFDEDVVAITFCPLCGTAISFIREVNGKEVEFGVSGKLHNSDLVMYDRGEESYWQQATGEAIIGPAAKRDENLEWVATTTTTWEKWSEKYPNTQVLSRETGYTRNYEKYPYGNYEENEFLLFKPENRDKSIHQKEVVFGITVNGQSKAYLEKDLISIDTIEDRIETETITIKYDKGIVTFTNKTTNEEYIPLRGFWFAWFAFHPNTLVYTPQ